jgi:hypothetical protein
MSRIVEIRSYVLKPGTRFELHALMTTQALPMLKRWDVDVVACGAPPNDENAYYLIRAYDNLEALNNSLDAFYGSDEWRQGPREAILALIDTYTSIVLELDENTINGLRQPIP